MGMFDRLKSDNKRILGGNDMSPVTLTNLAGVELAGLARTTDITLQINPQGQAFQSRTWSVAFHIDDFASITGANETYENWNVSFLNSEAETISGRFDNIYLDRTFGYVSVNIRAKKASA